MKTKLTNLTYEVKLEAGEKLILPKSVTDNIGIGSWVITIQPKEVTNQIIRDHNAFLQGYAPEDEGLYDDYTTG